MLFYLWSISINKIHHLEIQSIPNFRLYLIYGQFPSTRYTTLKFSPSPTFDNISAIMNSYGKDMATKRIDAKEKGD